MPSSDHTRAPLRIALLAQTGGLLAVGFFVFALSRLSSADFGQIPLLLALLQGGVAASIAKKLQGPPWWLPIHLGFMPLVVMVHGLAISPGWFLGGFVLLLLVFWRTDQSRVPLYLSNQRTAEALVRLLPPSPCRILDIGCGDGGLLRHLAIARPDCVCVGIEHAPLPWLLAWVRSRGIPNLSICHGDFWQISLEDYQFVYAFLSPAPMVSLWLKACTELEGDALLVSNSFPIPGIPVDQEIVLDDRRQTHLYAYRPDKAGDSAAIRAIPAIADQE